MGVSSRVIPVLKELYTPQAVTNLVLKRHAFLAMVKKNTGFYGKSLPIPVQHAVGSGGRSATFANAKANKSNNQYKAFNITHYTDYALASVNRLDVESSENDKGAFVRVLKKEFDGGFVAARESAARDCYGTGSGSMGVIAVGGIAGSTITLATPRDALKYEADMVIVLSATDGAGAGVRVGTITVLSVDRSLGVITFSGGVVAGIAAAAAGDFLFVDGDYDLKMPGLDGWLPNTAPTGGDNFFGVDRSIDPERLAGLRLDYSSMSPEEGMMLAIQELADRGADVDYAFMNSIDYTNIKIALGSKVEYDQTHAYKQANISFTGIKIHSHGGTPVTLLPDVYAPKGRVKLLSMNTWEMWSLKEHIRFLDFDGLGKLVRDSDADSGEFRLGGDKCLACDAPGHNADVMIGS